MKKTVLTAALALTLCSCGALTPRELSNMEPIETLCITLRGGRVKLYALAAVRDSDNVPLTFEMDGDSVTDAVERLKRLPEGKDASLSHVKNVLADTLYLSERMDELCEFLSVSGEKARSAEVFCADGVAELLGRVREGEGDVSADLEFISEHLSAESVTRADEVVKTREILLVAEQYGSVVPIGVEDWQEDVGDAVP